MKVQRSLSEAATRKGKLISLCVWRYLSSVQRCVQRCLQCTLVNFCSLCVFQVDARLSLVILSV